MKTFSTLPARVQGLGITKSNKQFGIGAGRLGRLFARHLES